MKIYAISLVKNEVDIIEHCLRSAAVWAEKIFVYDNGSTDGTWELVQNLAKEIPSIVAWKQDSKPFYEGMRGEVYEAFHHLGEEGDWWCFRLDSDEIYPCNPADTLVNIDKKYQVVAKESIEYVLTHEDIIEYDFTQLTPVNFNNIRYYLPNTYSEVRFIRHRDRLKWQVGRDMPKYMGITSPDRIKVMHFQYRSIPQMINRIRVRKKARDEGFVNWEFADNSDWKNLLFKRSEAIYDTGNHNWKLSAETNNYLPPYYKYIIQRVMRFMKIIP
ncbi:glycosyltransferase family 2 protein [Hymenobacter sp. APR13]|uniref:glycosyltransferase family 2 protein n=1 Tax=Hymenobacter sp. APR13 TaxID=1356852 RepID=UPI0004E05FC9|nr:glycosyltransferase family 2 protein [Hymenobacter sp. APR13]AII51133.1 hypothetical protein N008_03930 [Hymenobacter sp. APR13]